MNQPPYQGGGQPGYRGTPPPPPYYNMLPNPYKKPLRHNVNVVAGGLLLLEIVAFVLVYLISEVLYLFFPDDSFHLIPDWLFEVLEIIIYSTMFAVPILVLVAMIKIPPKIAFPMRPLRASLWIPAVFFCLGLSFLGSTLSAVVSALFEEYAGTAPTMPDMSAPYGIGACILYFISMAVIPAIFEELLFRGVILQSLRRFGDGFALVASSLLFAFCHGNLIQIPPTFLTGLAIGYFVLRSGSLLMGFVIHFANNGLSVVLDLVYSYGSDLAWAVADVAFLLIYILGAIIALVYLVVRHPNMFRIMPSNYPLHESEKYTIFFTAPVAILYIIYTIISVIRYFE